MSEPRAVATGSGGTSKNLAGLPDPVATALGSDTMLIFLFLKYVITKLSKLRKYHGKIGLAKGFAAKVRISSDDHYRFLVMPQGGNGLQPRVAARLPG